jgi:hypothetical protein
VNCVLDCLLFGTKFNVMVFQIFCEVGGFIPKVWFGSFICMYFFICVIWLILIMFDVDLVTENKFENYIMLRLVEHIVVLFVLPTQIIFLVNLFFKDKRFVNKNAT